MRLYDYLDREIHEKLHYLNFIRRTPTIIQLMHAIKTYYWISPPHQPSTYTVRQHDEESGLNNPTIVRIRSSILNLINTVMFKQLPGQDDKDLKRDEEFQCIFNFIATVHEDDNCYDLLTFVMRQLCDNPAVMIPVCFRV